VKFATQAHWSHSHLLWIFQTCGSIATDSLMLLFTKFKCTWLTAISMSLFCCINCQDVCVQQSHATKRLLP